MPGIRCERPSKTPFGEDIRTKERIQRAKDHGDDGQAFERGLKLNGSEVGGHTDTTKTLKWRRCTAGDTCPRNAIFIRTERSLAIAWLSATPLPGRLHRHETWPKDIKGETSCSNSASILYCGNFRPIQVKNESSRPAPVAFLACSNIASASSYHIIRRRQEWVMNAR